MADKEERIAVVPFQGDFLRTQAEWKREGKYPAYRLRNIYGITRAEAVGEMANAFIKYDRDRDKSKPLDPYKAMEAALDALLGKEPENGK